MREIEIKARVQNKQTLLQKLKEQGIELGPAKTHHDVVFCKPGQQDYEPGSIWHRIRTENGKTVMWTMKVDTGRKLDSIEHEITVSSGEELEAMLKQMGLELYSDLTKTRQKAKVGEIEICLDDVDNLGTFIEAEKLFEDHDTDYEVATAELWDLLNKLGVTHDDQETLGYDVLLKSAKN
ncbi:MAG TPA: class IV adenylate cyclase [Candidatus Saccharimonadales bacterium]|nr:class IV adenylate cyclase [Candidatus Saccharimonadales bacterium]